MSQLQVKVLIQDTTFMKNLVCADFRAKVVSENIFTLEPECTGNDNELRVINFAKPKKSNCQEYIVFTSHS
jgi:hypothetical protein